MKPIWYFVGILLALMGGVLILEGIRLLFSPAGKETILGSTHPNLWWGGIMLVAGLVFVLTNRKDKSDNPDLVR